MKDSLSEIFKRDLEKLKSEISLFDKEEDIWLIAGDIKNSSGNLCLHICGNLKHFIGYVIGGYDFIREREKEFSLKNVPREELLTDIDETIAVVLKTLNEMNNEIYDNKYPLNVFNKEMTNEFFFIHLTTHLSYHLGQINYLRRLMIN